MFFYVDFIPEGYTWSDIRASLIHDPFAIANLVVMIASLLFIAIVKLKGHQRSRRTPQVLPPDNISSVEAAYILKGRCECEDITSLIFSLTAKGLVSLDIFQKKGASVTLRRKPEDRENWYVKRYYDAVSRPDTRKSGGQPRTIPFLSMRRRFGEGYDTIYNRLGKDFSGEKALFTHKGTVLSRLCHLTWFLSLFLQVLTTALKSDSNGPGFTLLLSVLLAVSTFTPAELFLCQLKKRGRESAVGTVIGAIVGIMIYLFFGNLCVVACAAALTPFNSITSVVCLIVTPILLYLDKPRTERGRVLYDSVMGLRDFITSPDPAKCAEMTQLSPSYFYEIMPYAYAFGLEENWISGFRGLPLPAPSFWTQSFNGEPVTVETCSRFMKRISRLIHGIVGETSKQFHVSED